MLVWLDSPADATERLRSVDAAAISVTDAALTVGLGVFETVKVVHGQPFALTRHLRRLIRSAEALGIEAPPGGYFRAGVSATIAANSEAVGDLGRLRITLTKGAGDLADPYANVGGPSVLITVVAGKPWPPTSRVALSRYRRNEHSALTGVKSTSYAENAVALLEARRQGADEALLLNSVGDVCEGTGSNIVLAVDGVLVTPDVSSGPLPGITRELALEWCGISEARIPESSLARATEAFLTSSTRDLHPIAELGERRLPAPGPLTAAAQAAWMQAAASTVDP